MGTFLRADSQRVYGWRHIRDENIAGLVREPPSLSPALGTWLAIVRDTTQAEGRYLLVGVVAWATLLVAGSARLAGGRAVGVVLWPAIFAALDVHVLAMWLVPHGHL